MTASGPCNVCGQPAHSFIYGNPTRLPDGSHNGEWWCEEHDPRCGKPEEPEGDSPKARDGLSRKQRRALERMNKKRGVK